MKQISSLTRHFFTTLSTKKTILIITVFGFLVYSNGLFNNFVGDDEAQIMQNSSIHSIGNIPYLFFGSTFYNGGSQELTGIYYKPLLTTIFALLYFFSKNSPFIFHVFQLILHIANACLLYLVFKHFFKRSVSLILSIIFLVHPINSESVFYISAMQDTLFFFFGILSFWLVLAYQSKKMVVLAVFFLFLSLISKETGVLFIGLVSLYKLIFNRKHLFLLFASTAAIFAMYIFLRVHAIGFFVRSVNTLIDKLSLLDRTLNVPSIIFFYIKTFFLPLKLASSYQWAYTKLNIYNFFIPFAVDIVLLGSLCFLGFLLYKKQNLKYFKIYTLFFIWFSLGLVIHLQLIPLDGTVAERWFYFPIVGLLGMIGLVLEKIRIAPFKRFYLIIAFIVVLLAIRTVIRSFDWKDNFTLASHDIKVSTDSSNLENILSSELLHANRFEEAKMHAEKSIKIFPHIMNYNNLGLAYLALGKYSYAKDAFTHALQFGDYYVTYEKLAVLGVVSNGNPDINRKFIQSALQKFPQDPVLWIQLALLEYRVKNNDAAKAAITQAYLYDQSESTSYIYNQIMNNQGVTINLSY